MNIHKQRKSIQSTRERKNKEKTASIDFLVVDNISCGSSTSEKMANWTENIQIIFVRLNSCLLVKNSPWILDLSARFWVGLHQQKSLIGILRKQQSKIEQRLPPWPKSSLRVKFKSFSRFTQSTNVSSRQKQQRREKCLLVLFTRVRNSSI